MSASSINPDLLASIAKKFKIESPNEVEQRGAQSDSRKIHEGLLKLKDVAVKTLDYRRSKRSKPEDEVTLEETFRRRLREAEIWCKLRHPNILSFLGYTHAVDGIQLLSPWCENGSLIEYYTKQYQKKNINVPPEKRFHLLLDVARGLKYLHTEMQVYHGDLKGSNILIDRHGDALLCDFEHSIDVGTSDGLQSVRRGTTQYNSPELIGLKEGQIDVDVLTQSDVWAFGCTAIEILLPGTKPYERYSRVNQILYAIKLNHPPFEDGYREVDVDKRCWDIVQSCWSAADKRPGINKVYSDIKDFVVGIVHPDVLGRELTRIAEEKDFETGLSMGIRHADHHWEVIQNTCKSLHLPEPEEWNCFTLFLQYEDNCTNYTMTEEVKRETGEPPFLTFYRLQREGRKPRFSIEFDPKHRTELPKKKGVSYMKIFKTLFPQLDPEQWRLLIEYKGGETYLSSSSNPQRQFRKLREEGKGPYFAVRLLSKLRSPVYEQTRLGRDAAIQATYLNQPGKIFQPRDRYAVAYLPKIAEDGQGDILIGTGFQVVSDDPFKYRCRFIEKNEKGEISMSRRIDLDYKTVVLLQLPPSIAVLETQKRLDRTGRWAQIDSSTLARARSLKSYEPILLEYFIDPLGWWAYAVDSYQPQSDYELELFRDEGVRLLRTQKAWSYVAKLNGGKHGWVPSWVLEIDEEKEKNVRWM